eukprot:scaffold29813_cov52-Phaeocystis_antarctica.AAC.7
MKSKQSKSRDNPATVGFLDRSPSRATARPRPPRTCVGWMFSAEVRVRLAVTRQPSASPWAGSEVRARSLGGLGPWGVHRSKSRNTYTVALMSRLDSGG